MEVDVVQPHQRRNQRKRSRRGEGEEINYSQGRGKRVGRKEEERRKLGKLYQKEKEEEKDEWIKQERGKHTSDGGEETGEEI